jgi:NADPH-dependent F420 reductase
VTALAFLGGTGAAGMGLALRFAAAGEPVRIGSRVLARARAAADEVRTRVPGASADGAENLDLVARAERLVLTLPFEGLVPFLDVAGPSLAGKLVIDVVVPVRHRGGTFGLAPVPGAASAGEFIQQRAPGARVVSAFKHLSAERLRDLRAPLAGDVLLCGEDPDARAEVAALVRRLTLRPVDAGRLANAHQLEAITPLLMNLNARYHAQTSIAIVGLP